MSNYRIWRWRRKEEFWTVEWERQPGEFLTLQDAWNSISRYTRFAPEANFHAYPEGVDPNDVPARQPHKGNTGSLVEIVWNGTNGQAKFEKSTEWEPIDGKKLSEILTNRFFAGTIDVQEWFSKTRITQQEPNTMECRFYETSNDLYLGCFSFWRLNDSGRLSIVWLVSEDGKAFQLGGDFGGYWAIAWQYGPGGELIAQCFLDADRHLTVSASHGYAMVRYAYDGLYLMEKSFRDAEGKPIVDSGCYAPNVPDFLALTPGVAQKCPGYAYEQYSYDALGHKMETRYLDERRVLVYVPDFQEAGSKLIWSEEQKILLETSFDDRRRNIRTRQIPALEWERKVT